MEVVLACLGALLVSQEGLARARRGSGTGSVRAVCARAVLVTVATSRLGAVGHPRFLTLLSIL